MTAPALYSAPTQQTQQAFGGSRRPRSRRMYGGMGTASIGGGMQQPAPQTQQAPAPTAPTGAQQPQQAPQPAPSFSQMQQQGMARPAPAQLAAPQPQQQYDLTGQLHGAVSQALQQPGRYDQPEVQQVRDALTSQLERQFGAQKKGLDEELARRGLSASTIGGGMMGDLAGQQAGALAELNAKLIQDKAATNAADRSAALGAGQNFQTSLANQLNQGRQFGLDEQRLGLEGELGRGGLDVQRGQLDLSRGLGFGGLDIQRRAQDLDEKVRTGQMSVQERDQALRELQNQQQYGLQGRSANLAETLGLGGLDLQRQQYGENTRQFNEQLRQALEGMRMSDVQGHRGLDIQRELGLGNLDLGRLQWLAQNPGATGGTY